jgi:flagellar basal body-associated protein FliL
VLIVVVVVVAVLIVIVAIALVIFLKSRKKAEEIPEQGLEKEREMDEV